MQKRSPNILGQPLIYLGGLPEQNICLGNTAFKFAFFSSRNKSITLQINAKVKKKTTKNTKTTPKIPVFKWEKNPGSIPLSGSAPNVTSVYSGLRPIFVEIHSVVFVLSRWQTNQPTHIQTNTKHNLFGHQICYFCCVVNLFCSF